MFFIELEMIFGMPVWRWMIRSPAILNRRRPRISTSSEECTATCYASAVNGALFSGVDRGTDVSSFKASSWLSLAYGSRWSNSLVSLQLCSWCNQSGSSKSWYLRLTVWPLRWTCRCWRAASWACTNEGNIYGKWSTKPIFLLPKLVCRQESHARALKSVQCNRYRKEFQVLFWRCAMKF